MSTLEALRSRILNAQRNLDALRASHKSELDALNGSWQRKHDELQGEVRVYGEKLQMVEAEYIKVSADHKQLIELVEALVRSIENTTANVVTPPVPPVAKTSAPVMDKATAPAMDETTLSIPAAPDTAKMTEVRERLFYLADQMDFSGTAVETKKADANRPAAAHTANTGALGGVLDRAAAEITEHEDLRHLKGVLKVALR